MAYKASTICILSLVYCLAFAQIHKNCGYIEELNYGISHPSDTMYIEDRTKLQQIRGTECNDSILTLKGKSKNGDSLYIEITNHAFDVNMHVMLLMDTFYKTENGKPKMHFRTRDIIDGRAAYGIDGSVPSIEVQSFKIRWADTWLLIPDSAFHNLYQLHLCYGFLPVEVYTSNKDNWLYIYISASDGAGTYAVKLIFDRNKYLTRIPVRVDAENLYNVLDATEGCP